jgi:hypothetical protein
MNLAEALLLRADLQQRLSRLRERIGKNVRKQEGDRPSEDPLSLMKEAAGVVNELERLIIRINTANMKAKLRDGRTLMQAIAARDALKLRHAMLAGAVAATAEEPDRYSMREIKWVLQIDVAKTEKQMDDLAVSIRELNARIQEANWKHELAKESD